ncbi:pentatricopeptide repeat-containing protein At1g63330-like [Papaver somniferum]|uniref:pentatricopeptide repeat-containing protein At1g63330-like n=1 Tax=Papaver somniferum TaxID=3469 RepID=UPI000E6FD2E7|nr:pentatricopeptide repeat-containing protein At1g63330-like [Papaver somniferum]
MNLGQRFLHATAVSNYASGSGGFDRVITQLEKIVRDDCKSGKIKKLDDGSGIIANIEMYRILIQGLCQAGKLEDARKLFIDIPNKGLAHDVVTYTTMINSLFCEKMLSEANALIIQMEEKGCLQDARAFDTIIRGFLIAKETAKALHFLRKMRSRNISPSDSVITWLANTHLSLDEFRNL